MPGKSGGGSSNRKLVPERKLARYWWHGEVAQRVPRVDENVRVPQKDRGKSAGPVWRSGTSKRQVPSTGSSANRSQTTVSRSNVPAKKPVVKRETPTRSLPPQSVKPPVLSQSVSIAERQRARLEAAKARGAQSRQPSKPMTEAEKRLERAIRRGEGKGPVPDQNRPKPAPVSQRAMTFEERRQAAIERAKQRDETRQPVKPVPKGRAVPAKKAAPRPLKPGVKTRPDGSPVATRSAKKIDQSGQQVRRKKTEPGPMVVSTPETRRRALEAQPELKKKAAPKKSAPKKGLSDKSELLPPSRRPTSKINNPKKSAPKGWDYKGSDLSPRPNPFR